MLYSIDISNWQKGLTIPNTVDACIMKATEGITYVDHCCDGFVSQCKLKGKLWGYYHFMTSAEPEQQAAFFAEHTEGYRLEGIPVLDVEMETVSGDSWGEYAQRFVDKYHAITGVYPIIYASAAYLKRFAGYPLVDDCGLWVAGYPKGNTILDFDSVPDFCYDVSPWKFAALWQFTATGKLSGWREFLDLDIAYMDKKAWKLYANPNSASGFTQEMPVMEGDLDESIKRKWHFENDAIRVDVALK